MLFTNRRDFWLFVSLNQPSEQPSCLEMSCVDYRDPWSFQRGLATLNRVQRE